MKRAVMIGMAWSFVLALLVGLMAGCGGGGGDGGSSGPGEKAITSANAWVMVSGVSLIFGETVYGHPVGAINIIDAACPDGGTVSITGTLAASASGNLTYTFDNCVVTYGSWGTVTFISGSVVETGSFPFGDGRSMVVTGNVDLKFDNVFVEGSKIDRSYSGCDLSVTYTQIGKKAEFSGNLCGNAVEYVLFFQ